MRASQKPNRNRGKNNRQGKSLGNVANRVFESNGPEGKVRGTPQQIIEKYEQLARDAQTSGDRVMAENFLQHAEHYARLLSAAQAEAQQRAEQHAQQHQRPAREQQQNQQQRRDPAEAPQPDAPVGGFNGTIEEPPAPSGLEVVEPAEAPVGAAPSGAAGGEQPQSQPQAEGRGRRRRAPRRDAAQQDAAPEQPAEQPAAEQPAANVSAEAQPSAEGEEAPRPRRRPGRPRKSAPAAEPQGGEAAPKAPEDAAG
ncbi:DUF4167 domain-containing protein [Oceanicella actignis]|uniref:DUF4167 domain-containing protein n=1 Tax=Oceanicella actignis TaxID=1189325 RepID=A0A1M7S1N2_9RHOB|nr:DUF4167 domain-containing protein [Oceanicella actignis]SES90997.1 protein of unknown function [Oceanicella actignis]SHN52507.1 protein of unknown function [Oceanicella actignis]